MFLIVYLYVDGFENRSIFGALNIQVYGLKHLSRPESICGYSVFLIYVKSAKKIAEIWAQGDIGDFLKLTPVPVIWRNSALLVLFCFVNCFFVVCKHL